MTHHLLFVCSGNITRSPLAAAWADVIAMQLALDVEIRSAGTLGIVGRPAHPRMVAAARDRGLDLSRHKSQGLTPELCAWAHRIAVMEPHHAARVEELAADGSERVVQLGLLVGVPGIDDPTGSWFTGPYRRTRDQLEEAVRRFVTEVKDRAAHAPSGR